MKVPVKLKTVYASPEFTASEGTTIYVEKKEAKELVDGNFAEYVEKPSEG